MCVHSEDGESVRLEGTQSKVRRTYTFIDGIPLNISSRNTAFYSRRPVYELYAGNLYKGFTV